MLGYENMSSKFFTNTGENTVFEKFKGIFENMKDVFAFHCVVGYFRSSGYFALQPYLNKINDIKILVGINVDQMFAEAQRKGLLYFGDEKKTKDEFLKLFVQDLREAKYAPEVEKGILDFLQAVAERRIEVRAHNSKAIHAKFYLLLPENHSEHTDGWVLMGSSNLTEAGLGTKKSPNYELNIALKDFDDVEFTKNEFLKLWENSTQILPADFLNFKQKTHLGQIFTPFELYIKLLAEFFGSHIDYNPDTVGDLPKNYKKLSYQVDAVNEGFRMLQEHNGFFLADVVGLGKTVVAAMIAKRFLIANGSSNTKILVVFPPALEKNWKTTFKQFRIDGYAKFITNGRLEKIAEGGDASYWEKEDYDLILVDEAHKYRNHTSQSFGFLQRICKASRNGSGLVSGTKKKVILISATPLNNRPQDLYYQLQLFQDARRSSLSVTNLQSFFGPKIREYSEIMRSDEPDVKKIRELYKIIREKIISPITVRRTRNDLKNYPKYLDDLKAQGIIFPEIAPIRTVKYELDTKLGKLFYNTVFHLTDESKINYFRYQAISFLKPEPQKLYEQAVLVSKSLAGIMKTLMVKRLESSFYAFKITLNNLLASTQRMITMFENDKIFIAPDLKINDLLEKGISVEEIEEKILELSLENPKNNVFKAEDFKPEFLDGLKNDEVLLSELHEKWALVKEDPKIEKLFNALENDLLNADKNPTGKLVIFTESNDTANYLAEKLEARSEKGILKISSENRNRIFETIQANFDANYAGKPKDDFQILISTDVLSEGVNLHRANVLVNYDTPWNATRLMQRTGRINRIGSVAGVVYSYIFYPSRHGDEEIRLYKNALVKLQSFHSAFGEDAQVFTPEELVEQFELFKEGTGEEQDKTLLYLRFIREFKEANPKEFKRIKNFPPKARTSRKNAFAKTETVANSTVVFLKSDFKTEFYHVSKENQLMPLTFLEAAEIFEANASEQGYEVLPQHFKNVQAALEKFENDFAKPETQIVSTTDKADAISVQAKKILRDLKPLFQNEKTKTATEALKLLIEKGTFTQLPNEIRKLKTQLDKKTVSFAQVENLIFGIAKKYDAADGSMEDDLAKNKTEPNLSPEIVISETFLE